MNTPLRRALTVLLALVMISVALPVGASAEVASKAEKPTSVSVSETTVTIDLADTKTHQLSAKVLPEGASQRVVWVSAKKSVVTVNSKGLLTAKKVGSTSVRVRPNGVAKWTGIKVKVIDSLRPTSMTLPEKTVSLKPGETYQIEPTLLPANTVQDVKYTSSRSRVASVSAAGVIKAKTNGKTVVRVRSKRNSGLSRVITVNVAKSPAPRKIVITPADKAMTVGSTLTLSAAVQPDSAKQTVSWTSSNKKIATVSSTGVVKALKEGKVVITARSKAKSAVRTARTITVTDPNKPTKIAFALDETVYLTKGDAATLNYSVTPTSARRDATFSSSNKKVVSVDSTGRITANEVGTVTITITATGTKLKDTLKITVYNDNRTTLLPVKSSDSQNDIKENLAKIDAIRESAFNEIAALKRTGKMTSTEASLRKAAVGEAFANMGFAWETPSKVNYWDSSLSYNNYQPGRIYYGMPYIQCGANGNYTNRQYTLAKAVTQGYFKKKADASRFYSMTSKRLNKFYVGCDCSSFVSMAIWGTGHAASTYNTTAIAKSTYYKTISDASQIKPGDIMVKSGKHVIMFLYNCDKGMMLIENSTSVVSCKISTVQAYLSSGYVIKRPLKFL